MNIQEYKENKNIIDNMLECILINNVKVKYKWKEYSLKNTLDYYNNNYCFVLLNETEFDLRIKVCDFIQDFNNWIIKILPNEKINLDKVKLMIKNILEKSCK